MLNTYAVQINLFSKSMLLIVQVLNFFFVPLIRWSSQVASIKIALKNQSVSLYNEYRYQGQRHKIQVKVKKRTTRYVFLFKNRS